MTATSLVFGSAPRSVNEGWACGVPAKTGRRGGEIVRDGRLQVHPGPVRVRVKDAVGCGEHDGRRDQGAAAATLVDVVVVQGHEADVRMRGSVEVAVGDRAGDTRGQGDRHDERDENGCCPTHE